MSLTPEELEATRIVSREDFEGCGLADFLEIIEKCELVRFSKNIVLERLTRKIGPDSVAYSWVVEVESDDHTVIGSTHETFALALRRAQNIDKNLSKVEEE